MEFGDDSEAFYKLEKLIQQQAKGTKTETEAGGCSPDSDGERLGETMKFQNIRILGKIILETVKFIVNFILFLFRKAVCVGSRHTDKPSR